MISLEKNIVFIIEFSSIKNPIIEIIGGVHSRTAERYDVLHKNHYKTKLMQELILYFDLNQML